MISLLDCTLRDGGYVNAWNFGAKNIVNILNGLVNAGLDYVEVGFLQSKEYDPEKTLFRHISEMERFIPQNKKHTKFCGMITYGDYALTDIPEKSATSLDGLRIIFKKNNWPQALEYCEKVKEKGYDLFINPMHTYAYSDRELLDLIEAVNKIEPMAFTIVDTMGVMSPEELVRMFMLIDHNLAPKITLAFHSHNNLQQAYLNAKSLVELRSKRSLMIDVSVMGMGRGAGNLNAELMIRYLNEVQGYRYNILPILKICDEYLSKVFMQSPWGYSVPYYLAASHRCHPNYASFLMDKQSVSVEVINDILSQIPEDKKRGYDKELIGKLYLDYQQNWVDDREAVELLSKSIGSSPVLILGSGKSILTHKASIEAWIEAYRPFIISLNVKPELYDVDLTFISNAKRFAEQRIRENIIITSNIQEASLPTLNYGSYVNSSEMPDNSFLMLAKVLASMGIREVAVAGCDGFSKTKDNYFSDQMINNAKLGEFDRRNKIMSEELAKLSRDIRISFITPTFYEV